MCFVGKRSSNIFSNKFDITKHKQYQNLSDFDPKNTFDIENYVKNRSRWILKEEMKVDEVFDLEGYGNDNSGANAQVP